MASDADQAHSTTGGGSLVRGRSFRDDEVPYFLWDDPMTASELRHRLGTASEPERLRLLGRVLREARDIDVWQFTTLDEVVSLWPQLLPHLGRRRPFWEFILGQWGKLRPTHGR